jgi:hypothetical protein
MKVTDNIGYKINRLPKGYIFTYADFVTQVNKKEAVIKALNRMAKSGKISKLSKGRYYKPEKTPFGNLLPNQEQVVKDLLEDDGKIVGYLTGYSIYNKLGFTTQVGNIIQIGKNETRPQFKRGLYTIAFLKQKNTITKENILLLQILDTIRTIKKIPDARVDESSKRLLSVVEDVTDRQALVRLAMKYPPSTRALLGAVLEDLGNLTIANPLFESLNPITKYRFDGVEKVIKSANKWNIT